MSLIVAACPIAGAHPHRVVSCSLPRIWSSETQKKWEIGCFVWANSTVWGNEGHQMAFSHSKASFQVVAFDAPHIKHKWCSPRHTQSPQRGLGQNELHEPARVANAWILVTRMLDWYGLNWIFQTYTWDQEGMDTASLYMLQHAAKYSLFLWTCSCGRIRGGSSFVIGYDMIEEASENSNGWWSGQKSLGIMWNEYLAVSKGQNSMAKNSQSLPIFTSKVLQIIRSIIGHPILSYIQL